MFARMMFTRFLAMAVILSALFYVVPVSASDKKTIATDLLIKGLAQGNMAYINKHVREDYIQHNPVAPDGRAGLLGFIGYLKSSKISVSVKPVRVLEDGNLVVVHSAYDIGGKKIIFDLFRFEDGRIVEHWDGIQDKPAKTVSGRTMLDGSTEITDRAKTDENRTLVTQFVTDVLVKGKVDKISAYIGDVYLQHNPNVGDGLDGLGKFLKHLKDSNISFAYKKVHHVIAEGNFVFTLSEGEIGGKTHAIYDLFRVMDGKIVEHWDVVQAVPAKMAHNNGMF